MSYDPTHAGRIASAAKAGRMDMESSYDWNRYHRAQEWVAKNHPEQVVEFPDCWDEAWEAVKDEV
jgi:hypothetical protein